MTPLSKNQAKILILRGNFNFLNISLEALQSDY